MSGTGPRRFTARRRWGVAAVAIAAAMTGSLAFWLSGGPGGALAAGGPQTTTVRHGEVWLQGKITQDGCDQSAVHIAIGDVGCSITVNGYDVSVVPGNIRLPHAPGTVTGLAASANQAGKHAHVYAQLTGPHSATILSAPKYYARISG
ncbi:MAG TPA: hypothetical protein VF838_06935 [Trebonia sp.]